MAAKMEAQAKEIEKLWMELERTNLKKDEDIPGLSTRALEGLLQEERVTQWVWLCVGALKNWMETLQVGELLRRPLNHAGGSSAGDSPPRDHVLGYRVWEVLCKSHTAYMTRYMAQAGKEPKGRSPYASLDEARGAPGSDFHWKNVHF